MDKVTLIGADTAKSVFQVRGVDGSGVELFNRKLSRAKFLPFLAEQPACVVVLEACGGAHHWAREIARFGHEVRLIPPAYVKPFAKRQKSDAIDVAAICEAAVRPEMRFVPVKSEEQQARATVLRARDLLVRQRTQLINALRGLMAEFGCVVAKGAWQLGALAARLEEPSAIPDEAREPLLVMVDTIRTLEARIDGFDRQIAERVKQDADVRRLTAIPGIGPLNAVAITALAPSPEHFRRGRDFAAWVGLTPCQHSTGGKQKLGAITKMGERTIRRLLIIGAASVVNQACRRGAVPGSWLAGMLARKPRMLVIVALANKMARTAWALLAHQSDYKAPTVTA